MQTLKEMVWLVPSMTPMALGTTPVVYQISRKERLQRKKYIGVCRLLLLHTRAMVDPLPITVRVYISANTTTKETRNCHVPGKPRRMNSSTLVPFAMSFQMLRSVWEERKVSVKICVLVLVLQMLQVEKKKNHHPQKCRWCTAWENVIYPILKFSEKSSPYETCLDK